MIGDPKYQKVDWKKIVESYNNSFADKWSEPCDFKNCKFYFNGNCTNSVAYENCELMDARMQLRCADDVFRKFMRERKQ